MVELYDMGGNDTHLLELLSLSLVLDVTPSASQQERDSNSEHTTERSHAAQNSNAQERDTELPTESGHRRPTTSRPPTGRHSSNPDTLDTSYLSPEPSQSAKSLPRH